MGIHQFITILGGFGPRLETLLPLKGASDRSGPPFLKKSVINKLRELIKKSGDPSLISEIYLRLQYSLLSAQQLALSSCHEPKLIDAVDRIKTHLSWAKMFLNYIEAQGVNERIKAELHGAEVNLAFAYTDLLFKHLGESRTEYILSAPFGPYIDTVDGLKSISLDDEHERSLYIRDAGLSGFVDFFSFALAQRFSPVGLIMSCYENHPSIGFIESVMEGLSEDVCSMRQLFQWIEGVPQMNALFKEKWDKIKGRTYPLTRVMAVLSRAEVLIDQMK